MAPITKFDYSNEFKRYDSIEELLAGDEDGILFIDPPPKTERPLAIIQNRAVIHKLHGARYYISTDLRALSAREDTPVAGLVHRKGAGLLLTAKGALFSGSFVRDRGARKAINHSATDNSWSTELPRIKMNLPGLTYYAEMWSGHFGHALVDMPGRLWPLALSKGKWPDSMTFSGVGTHSLKNTKAPMPTYTSQLLSSFGVPPDRCISLTKSVSFSQLIVPSWLSPFQGPYSPHFDRLMKRAGRLLCSEASKDKALRRLYLSRSQLPPGNRSLPVDIEVRIENLVRKFGFTVVHPQIHTLGHQVSVIRHAERIAGQIGSQLHLAAFCETPNAKMFRLRPSFFSHDIDAKLLVGVNGVVHDFVVQAEQIGKQHTSPWSLSNGDFERLADEFERWLSV